MPSVLNVPFADQAPAVLVFLVFPPAHGLHLHHPEAVVVADPDSPRRLEQQRHFRLVFGVVELSINITILIISMIRVAGAAAGVVDVIVSVTVIVTVMIIISINICIIITTRNKTSIEIRRMFKVEKI